MSSKSNCVIYCVIAFPLSKSNCVVCKIYMRINHLEFGHNDHREDAPYFSFCSRRILSGIFLPIYEIFNEPVFRKKILQFNNFRNFHNCDVLENQIEFFRNRNFAIIAIHFISLDKTISNVRFQMSDFWILFP